MSRSAAVLVAAVVVQLTVACSVTSPGKAMSASSEPSTTASSAATLPAGRFPRLLSSTTANTGRTVTAAQLSAEIAVSEAQKPVGYRTQAVIVSGGLGGFQVALPTSYPALWRVGTPFDELLAQASSRDRGWADYARSRLATARPDGPVRAMAVDGGPSDRVNSVLFTLTRAPAESGEALAQVSAQQFEGQGQRVRHSHAVTVNGAAGAYIEFTIPARLMAGAEPRVGMQVLVPDPPNRMLWGLTCDGPESDADRLRFSCAQLAATFRPAPTIAG